MANIPQNTDTEAQRDTAQYWVVRSASGEMSEAELSQFRAWLAQSAPNRAAFERELAVWEDLEQFRGQFQAPAAPDPARRPVVSHARPRWRAMAVAGALAACLAIAALMPASVWTGLIADYSVAAGEQRSIPLPDGSVATLNTASAIKLHFSRTERVVELLEGEAYFEVEPDRQRPFRVIAGNGSAQAVGTAFSVRSGPHNVDVVVTKGVVAVVGDRTARGEPVLVRKGERVSYGSGVADMKVTAVDADAAIAWRNGQIYIDAPSFSDALAELQRYWPGRILMLRDPETRRRVSLVASVQNVEHAITGLAASNGYTVTRIGSQLLILR